MEPEDGIPFGLQDKKELLGALEKDYIVLVSPSLAVTCPPLQNRADVKPHGVCKAEVSPKNSPKFTQGTHGQKSMDNEKMAGMMAYVDVLVDGRFK